MSSLLDCISYAAGLTSGLYLQKKLENTKEAILVPIFSSILGVSTKLLTIETAKFLHTVCSDDSFVITFVICILTSASISYARIWITILELAASKEYPMNYFNEETESEEGPMEESMEEPMEGTIDQFEEAEGQSEESEGQPEEAEEQTAESDEQIEDRPKENETQAEEQTEEIPTESNVTPNEVVKEEDAESKEKTD